MHTPLECGLEAATAVRVAWSEIPALRKSPAGPGSESLAAIVRLSDEQTVLGLAALARARVATTNYRHWGLVASARYFGRLRFAASLERCRKLQARASSPLVVPHLSLHSIAGTLTLAAGTHGPHFGVGGGPGHLSEALLLGLGTLRRESLPGLWLIATDLNPEPACNPAGELAAPPMGQAIALALVPSASMGSGRLRLSPGESSAPEPRLTDLVDHLLASNVGAWRGTLPGVGTLEIRPPARLALTRAA